MNITIKQRLGKVFVGVVMWLIFSLAGCAIFVLQGFGILLWLLTGWQSVYAWVGRTGKSSDQLANAGVLGGHHKETVSSHAGRYYEAKFGNSYKGRPATDSSIKIPVWAVVVNRITGLIEKDHVLKAVEESFLAVPLGCQ